MASSADKRITMISLNNISYAVDDRTILSDVSFAINGRDKIGLVGPNGVGKTTLLNLIYGKLQPTSGKLATNGVEIGLLPQDLRGWLDYSVYQFVEETTGVKAAREEFDKQCANLGHDTSEETLRQYTKALERYERYGVASFDANLDKALEQADLSHIDTSKSIGSFSGGQRTRIALVAILASRYDVMLLDEPTNNLDERGVVLLEKFIADLDAAFVIVSHDRLFLRNATSRIIELVGGGVKQYRLGYDEYVEARHKAKQATIDEYNQYEQEKKRLVRAAKAVKARASAASSKRMSSDGDKLTTHFRKEKASNNLASAAMGMASRLGRLEEPERPTEDASLKFLFKADSKKKATLLDVRDVEVKHGNSCVIGPVSLSIRNGERILLKGENGSGKTSIINAIVSGEDRVSGDVYLNHKAGMVYIDQNQSLPLPNKSALDNIRYLVPQLELHDAINLLLRFNMKKEVIQGALGGELSGGERAKILLAGVAANNSNLLIMDEPTNNLDIPSVEALETAINGFGGGILFVSHDRDFVEHVRPTQVITLSSAD